MRALLAMALALALCAAGEPLALAVEYSKEEIAKILQHGPWPPQLAPDPTNRVSGQAAAIALGEKLFFEPRLSGTGSVLCATCHVPSRGFQDGRARAFGLEAVDRNTPSVVNARFYRWFGWDGARDSLWSQSIRPLLDAREMRSTPAQVANTMRLLFSDPYEKAFARPLPVDDNEVLADVGKALAAYQETLVSARSAFDQFRDALEKGGPSGWYPVNARKGLKIFVGKGNCSACHFGPQFTRASRVQQRSFGEVRVPGLRGVKDTAPYMHDGGLATLRDVVKFHSQSGLSEGEVEDLAAFLETL